jgi:hypothetical protein
MKKYKITFCLSVLFCLLFAVMHSADALRITLKRVVFEGPKRAEVITIINNKNDPVTYRLGWRHFVMTADKSLAHVEESSLPPEVRPSKDMVKFAPRRFTINPGGSQQVRMILRMPAGTPDGEYRSHLWVRPEASVDELTLNQDQNGSDPNKGVSVTMLAGVTMPIIVRKGNLSATVEIANFRATQAGTFINASFSMVRQGERSVYGDIEYICNPGAGEYQARLSRGNAIYAETSQRNFNLQMEKDPTKPSCNSLKVKFTETDGFDGDSVRVLAEAVTPVQ